METIIINGASGFLGSEICNYFMRKYKIITLKRSDYLLPSHELAKILEGADYIINLAGFPVSSLWTEHNRSVMYNSRIEVTRNLAEAICLMTIKPKLFVSASGINIYRDGFIHNESSLDYGDGFLSKLCLDWEQEALKVSNEVPVAIIRTGIVLKFGFGFLKQLSLTLPFRFLIKFGKGHHALPFISIMDYLSALEFLMERKCNGIFNFVAPENVSYAKFYTTFAAVSGCWFLIKMPALFLKILPGKQYTLFTRGPQVLPEALINAGFKFKHPSLNDSINLLISKH